MKAPASSEDNPSHECFTLTPCRLNMDTSLKELHEIAVDNHFHLLKPVECDGGTKLSVPNDPDKVIISRVRRVSRLLVIS